MNRRMWIVKKLCLLVLAFLGGAQPAMAHPHVWTVIRNTVVAGPDGKITGLKVDWTFDETYSGFALEGLDTNGDGTFAPEEIAPLTKENIESLVESNYFISIKQSGKSLPYAPVTEFGQGYDGAKLTLWFLFPLKEAVDAKAGPIEFKVYDPDFFIAFDYATENPAKLEGQLAGGCAMTLKPLPTTEELDQTRTFLADKGTDWKPEDPQDFGAMFAQALVVSCG